MSCCRCTIPFGLPVEPEEYIQNAMSSRCVSAGASLPGARASHSALDSMRTGPGAAASPFVTTTAPSFVSRQASPLKRSTKAELALQWRGLPGH